MLVNDAYSWWIRDSNSWWWLIATVNNGSPGGNRHDQQQASLGCFHPCHDNFQRWLELPISLERMRNTIEIMRFWCRYSTSKVIKQLSIFTTVSIYYIIYTHWKTRHGYGDYQLPSRGTYYGYIPVMSCNWNMAIVNHEWSFNLHLNFPHEYFLNRCDTGLSQEFRLCSSYWDADASHLGA